MNILFAGTPAFAVPSLRAAARRFPVAAVLTQPDRPQGRKRILTPSPVKQAAEELGIPVLQPARLKEALSSVRAVGADVLVTCAYGQILTQEALDLFPLGVWNVHASLLPKFRGAAPVSAAILAGERETGVTFNEYLNRLRVSKAKELLRSPELRLTDVAQLVGYEDQSYFTKVFKRVTGVLPHAYRASGGDDSKTAPRRS